MATSPVDKAALQAKVNAVNVALADLNLFVAAIPDPVIPPLPLSDDGYPGVPGGAIPFPALFAPYPKRPSWKVAGVDYGIGATGPLKDWWTATGPGISVDKAKGLIRIDGTSGVRLIGYDLSLHGGCRIYIASSPNAALDNCNIINGPVSNVGFTAGLIQVDPQSPGFTMIGCTVDGGSPTLGKSGSSLVSILGGGPLVFEYNLLRNSPQHAFEIDGPNLSFRRRFNVMSNIGNNGYVGAHPNCLQWGKIAFTGECLDEYNTAVQPVGIAAGEVNQYYSNFGGLIPTPTMKNFTIVCAGTTPGQSASWLVRGPGAQTVGTCTDNWMDFSGAWGPFVAGTFPGWTFARNVDLRTGQVIAFP